jgi:hypothetical protein
MLAWRNTDFFTPLGASPSPTPSRQGRGIAWSAFHRQPRRRLASDCEIVAAGRRLPDGSSFPLLSRRRTGGSRRRQLTPTGFSQHLAPVSPRPGTDDPIGTPLHQDSRLATPASPAPLWTYPILLPPERAPGTPALRRFDPVPLLRQPLILVCGRAQRPDDPRTGIPGVDDLVHRVAVRKPPGHVHHAKPFL